MSNGALFLIIVAVAFFVFATQGGKESYLRGSTYWAALAITGAILWIIWTAHAPIIPVMAR